MKTTKVIESISEENKIGVELEHHWKEMTKEVWVHCSLLWVPSMEVYLEAIFFFLKKREKRKEIRMIEK